MRYALLVYDREDRLADLPEPDREAVYREYQAFAATAGLAGYRLQPAATTLRIGEDGRRIVQPGPVRADALMLAGFYLLDPCEPERALELAGRIPAARLGGAVEVHALA